MSMNSLFLFQTQDSKTFRFKTDPGLLSFVPYLLPLFRTFGGEYRSRTDDPLRARQVL